MAMAVGTTLSAGMTSSGELAFALLRMRGRGDQDLRELLRRVPRPGPTDVRRRGASLAATQSGTAPAAASRDDLLNWLFATSIQPAVRGGSRPVMVHGVPASQAALARLDPHRPETAMRFEVFYRGVELANGYDELTEAAEVEQRLRRNQSARRASDSKPFPCQNISSPPWPTGPPCTGVALGFDRLVLLSFVVRILTWFALFLSRKRDPDCHLTFRRRPATR